MRRDDTYQKYIINKLILRSKNAIQGGSFNIEVKRPTFFEIMNSAVYYLLYIVIYFRIKLCLFSN